MRPITFRFIPVKICAVSTLIWAASYGQGSRSPLSGEPSSSLNSSSSAHKLTPRDFEGLPLFQTFEGVGKKNISGEILVGKGTGSAAIGLFTTTLQNMIRKATQLKGLAPGRDAINVNFVPSRFANASMNGQQNLEIHIINAGLSAHEMMPILCHEVAHSAQNHVALSVSYRKLPEYAPASKNFDNLIVQFLTRFYVGSFLEVNQRGIAEHIKNSLPYTATIAPLFQRLESQADIVGAMICAHWGLQPQEYAAGFSAALSKVSQLSRKGNPFKNDSAQTDDATNPQISKTERAFFLSRDAYAIAKSPMNSHPQAVDRLEQINNLIPLIESHYDATATQASDIMRYYDGHIDEILGELNEWNQYAFEPSPAPKVSGGTSAPVDQAFRCF